MPVPVPLVDHRPEGAIKLNKSKYVGMSTNLLIQHNQVVRHTSDGRSRLRSNIFKRGGLLRPPSTMHSAVHPHSRLPPQARHHTLASSPLPGTVPLPPPPSRYTPIEWDWEIEHKDRMRESKADSALHGTQPFQVDRRVLKEVVRERARAEVGRITFLSSGTFHKAYLISLTDTRTLVARVARRFMPRLKTESEVATMHYLRTKTTIPVPDVYHYDSNQYNRLGGEYIIMSQAPGIPLAQVYHTMSNEELNTLFTNLASIILPVFAQRFSHIGSLYFGAPSSPPTTVLSPVSSSSTISPAIITPTPARPTIKGFNFMPLLSVAPSSSSCDTPKASYDHNMASKYDNATISNTCGASSGASPSSSPPVPSPSPDSLSSPSSRRHTYQIGPIISWPFFGSNRGLLNHPTEINRGPWPTTSSYLASCTSREITSVIHESEGRSASHRLHLDPAEINSSRHHHIEAFPEDADSDESDEWDAQESEEEWEECVGDAMYRDYRRMQRGTFLVAHIRRREEAVRKEMGRWLKLMDKLGACRVQRHLSSHGGTGVGSDEERKEEFGLDCHDLSLENVFVDQEDHTRITCVIDWESTTTRPLWACAHLPAFVQSSLFTVRLFREAVAAIATGHSPSLSSSSHSFLGPDSQSTSNATSSLSAVASEWLYYESWGARLRHAHRCVEWDGWEEGLVESILGSEDAEEEWFKEGCACEEEEDVRDREEGCACEGTGQLRRGGRGDSEMEYGEELDGVVRLCSRRASFSAVALTCVPVSASVAPEPEAALLPDIATPHISRPTTPSAALRVQRRQAGRLILKKEKEQEQTLVSGGDICGGRGGELGRRLEEVMKRGLANGR
ncbi:hypothetical protein J3A83DRAFT_2523341 [Scleroderma citrinum]